MFLSMNKEKRTVFTQAFSLLEVLLVTTMMSIIVFGLYSMLSQTQKSFRASNAQIEVMSTAREALEVLSRDIEQIVASDEDNGLNFMTLLSFPHDEPPMVSYGLDNPMIQHTIPGDVSSGPFRTNYMQDVFLMQKLSNCWMPCAYFVGDSTISTNGNYTNAVFSVGEYGVGTLYRMGFTVTNELGEYAAPQTYDTNMVYDWMDQFRGINGGASKGYFRTNAFALAEGVIHFSIRVYDAEGQYIQHTNYYRPNQTDWNRRYYDEHGIWRTNSSPQKSFSIYAPNPNLQMGDLVEKYLDMGYWGVSAAQRFFPTNGMSATNLVILGQVLGSGSPMIVTDTLFMADAIPSYVEMELGILEPQALEKAKSIGNSDARKQYLMKNSGRVHLFRKRIPIRLAAQ